MSADNNSSSNNNNNNNQESIEEMRAGEEEEEVELLVVQYEAPFYGRGYESEYERLAILSSFSQGFRVPAKQPMLEQDEAKYNEIVEIVKLENVYHAVKECIGTGQLSDITDHMPADDDGDDGDGEVNINKRALFTIDRSHEEQMIMMKLAKKHKKRKTEDMQQQQQQRVPYRRSHHTMVGNFWYHN